MNIDQPMSDRDRWSAPIFFSAVEQTRIVRVGGHDGPQVITVDAQRCANRTEFGGRECVCPRVEGHHDDCWLASTEFVDDLGGALAIVARPKRLGL